MNALETEAYESAFPVANQIRAAKSHQERAGLLLRLSDAALLAGHVEIELALGQTGFAGGHMFVVWRISALCRQRDAHGLLANTTARELEAWRETLSRIAAGVATIPAPASPVAPAQADREGKDGN